MSAFTADWLRLREPADTAARSVVLRDRVVAWAAARRSLAVADLGAGTGATLRWLAPVLGAQRWLLVDHDAELLAALPEQLSDWAAAQGRRWHSAGQRGVLDDACRVAWRGLDLGRELDRLPWDELDLITASALLDLVSAEWLDRLTALCAAYRVALYCMLSVDGELSWTPALAGDDRMTSLFVHHQHGDKGFGPALGPDAVEYLVRRLETLGYRVVRAASPWQLDRSHYALQRALLEGYQRVIDELAADDAEMRDWWGRRLACVADSTHRVGHRDIFAWLP